MKDSLELSKKMFDNLNESFNESVCQKEVKYYRLSCSLSILAYYQWILSSFFHLLSNRTLDHYLSYDYMLNNCHLLVLIATSSSSLQIFSSNT